VNEVAPGHDYDGERRDVWGREYMMGVAPDTTALPVVKPTSFVKTEDFWALPDDLVALYIRNDSEQDLLKSRWLQLPAIGYQRVPVAKRPTWQAQPDPAPEARPDPAPEAQPVRAPVAQPDAAPAQPGPAPHVPPVPQPKQWGEDWAKCKVGNYAVIESEYADGSGGIDILKVTAKDDGLKEFTGRPLTCTVIQNIGKCIRCCCRLCCVAVACSLCVVRCYNVCLVCRGSWNSGRVKAEDTAQSYNVICYFTKVNKGGKLPAAIIDKLESHRADLFKRPKPTDPEADVSEYELEESPSDSD
jgi:hypothetical protein